MLLPSSRKAGGSHIGSCWAPLCKALINPDLSRALTRRRGTSGEEAGGLESEGVGGSLPLKMLRLIKSTH